MTHNEKVIAINLQNFMGFVDTKWIELRPITLLYGWNSTGKSAIVRALLLLRQSLGSGQREPLAFVADNGADLGSFWRMIRGKTYYDRKPPDEDKDPAERAKFANTYDPGELRQMVFGFRCGVTKGILEALEISPRNEDEEFIDLYLNFQWNKPQGKVELSAITLEAPRSKDFEHPEWKKILQAEFVKLPKASGWHLSSDFFGFKELHYTRDQDVPGKPKAAEQLKTWIPYFDFTTTSGFLPEFRTDFKKEKDGLSKQITKEADAIVKIETVFRDCCSAVKNLFRDDKFRHLGPIRTAPRRTYLLSDLSLHKWDSSGQAAIYDYLRSYEDNGSTKKDELNTWLQALSIGKKLHVNRLELNQGQGGSFTEAFQLGVEEGGETTDVNVRDVGYGLSQILPIVLQVLAAPDDGLIIIEQPELHLHPEAQAVLADLFISATGDRRCFLIETHSEHIQLRLQLRMLGKEPDYLLSSGEGAEKYRDIQSANLRVKWTDVHLIFVTRDKDSGVSKVDFIRTDPRGRLVGGPVAFNSFFSRDFLDSSVISVSRDSLQAKVKEEINEIRN